MALNDVIYNKKVDVAQAMPVPVVFAKQNDNAKRKVVVTLVKNGQPFALGTGVNGYIQGATAPNPVTKRQIKFKRDLTAIDTTQGTATFIITESMTAEIGITQCEVSIYDTEKPQEILCTANINIEVQGTGMSLNDEMASDDYQAIVNIKAEVTAMRDEVVTKTAQAIAAQSAAETAAQNAYNSALNVQKIVAGNEAYTKQEADLKYSVAPRKAQNTTTGEMQLTDSDDGLAYLSLEGNSEQYTNTANKNLIDLHFCTYGYIDNTTPGTPAPNAMMSGFIRCDISKSYILNMHNTITMITFVFYDKDKNRLGDIKKARLIATPEDYPSGTYWMRVNMSTLLKDQMQLEEGTVSTAYVQGAVDTPSPDYPSEVKSVGDIPKDSNGVEIRNLLNEEWLRSQPISSWLDGTNNSYYINIGEMIPQEKRKDLGYFVELTNQNTIEGLDSQTYISVSSIGGGNRSMLLVNGNTPQRGSSADLRTYPDLNLVIWKNNSTMTKEEIIHYYLTHFRYMITYVKDKNIDEYRPYIGENNGLIKLESSGINRADAGDGPISMAGENNIEVNTWTPRKIVLAQKNKSASWAYVKLNVERGKTYTFYCKAKVEVIEGTQTDDATSIGFRQYPPGGVMHGKKNLLQDGQYKDIYNTTGVIPDDVPNMAFMIYLSAQAISNGNIKITIDDLMVVEGEKTLQEMQALKFQPYYQQITWIPLREPLRGLPDGRADTIDRDGNVIQYIDCSGVEQYSIAQESAQIFEGNLFKTSFKNGNYVGIAKKDNGVYCNIMKFKQTASLQYGVSASPLYGVIYFNLKGKLSENTVDLARKFLNDNNAVFYFTLRTPITYQIPAIYIETYEPVTNVRCLNKVKPSTMGLDYKLAISSLIKRLEALETTAVQEVTRNV
nr:MAG: bppU [Bacteriophage sp.]